MPAGIQTSDGLVRKTCRQPVTHQDISIKISSSEANCGTSRITRE
jgi:hypothetical protein